MSERQLRTLLERSASTIPTGQPPMPMIERMGRRRGRRRLVGAMGAAVCVIGLGTTLAFRVSSNEGEATLTPAEELVAIDLPTSGWRPGEGGDGAVIEGVLQLDAEGCVYLGGLPGSDASQRMPVVWPAEYSAAVVDGVATLFDADGNPVATEGDRIRMGGGFSAGVSDHRCAAGEVAYVQSDVENLDD
jgi:hypothetical protein